MKLQDMSIVYPPTIHKGNGEHSNIGHRRSMFTYNGLFFLHGNGCKKHHDCLSCPLKECTWTCGSAKPDEVKDESK